MRSPKTALILVGSAKPAGQSTSEALGRYLGQGLQAHGLSVATMHVARALRTPERTAALLQEVDCADLFILAFPLYVDSLPYLAVEALERIAAHRQVTPAPAPTAFLAIANCGFPEAHHNQTALEICEQFAAAAAMTWAGGLALGAGGAVHGQPLAAENGMTRHVARALDLTAAALAAGEAAPAEAVSLMAQPLIPQRMYLVMGEIGWRIQALRNGVLHRLRARPLANHAQ